MKKKKINKRRRYSLNERINYYNKILSKNENNFHSNKVQYALGYSNGVSGHYRKNFKEVESKAYQNGVDAGLKALHMSRDIKF